MGMDFVQVNGGRVAYDLLGPDDGQPVVVTPGGRFGMDFPGVRPLGEALAAGGMRVLLWDRPNCGHSDVQFFGRTESHMRADTLSKLVRELELGTVVLAGGSGGARDSMLTAMLHPDIADKLILWSIVGGVFSSINLLGVYNMPTLRAVLNKGMEGVVAMPDWSEVLTLNPNNRDRFLAFDRNQFFRVMRRWMNAFVPKAGYTIPGIEDQDFATMSIATLIVRGGEGDLDHPKQTSFDVHALIKGSTLVDPPWPEDAWERGLERSMRGEGGPFDYWHMVAPAILDFIARSA
jgi:2-hydroxy-6-oxonona-2,4-dienedioate hydrolase